MNPLTNVKNITKLTERELELGIVDVKNSWHNLYKDSAWIFVGGLHFDLSEGDIIAVFSQYGEVVNINLVRDRKTGKSRGFAFLCYENQLSTVLAVDNFNGIKLLNRIIRVDHVEEYKIPKEFDDWTPEMRQLYNEGCAPKPIELPKQASKQEEIKSIKRPRSRSPESKSSKHRHHRHEHKSHKHHKKEKKNKKKSKHHHC